MAEALNSLFKAECIRNARSRISGEYFLFIVFHPCLKNGTKVRPIQGSSHSRV